MSDDDDEEDTVQEDEPIPSLGWTTKVWYKPGCESSVSHHRLMSILQTYYGDWDAAVKYVCDVINTCDDTIHNLSAYVCD